MLHQLDIEGRDKVDKAIMRIQTYEPEEGYYLCFSGGKDSCVIKALADMAGVKYDAHYSVTGIDPPDLVKFIKEYHSDVIFDYPRYKDGRRKTMWSLIPERRMPPTRLARYCCQELKETGGKGRFVITGVRWGESVKRKNSRHIIEQHGKNGKRIFSTDNVEDAPTFKYCRYEYKRVLNPIVDWTDSDVWEFIHENNLPYCKLYDKGKKRLGCIGCPMANNKAQLEEYPKFRNLYMYAFERMQRERERDGLPLFRSESGDTSAQAVMDWWLQASDEKQMPDTEITQMLESLEE